MKKLVVLLMIAGVICAANAVTVRYRGSGSWDQLATWDGVVWSGTGWQSSAVPGTGIDARLNWGNNTVTLDYAAPAVGNLKIGVDEGGNLIVNDGGVMTSESWSGIGVTGAINASMIVNNGGTVNIGSHLWMGAGPAGNYGQLDINGGIVNVGGNIGLGTINASTPSGGTAVINVNDGGLLNLYQWSSTTSIMAGSVLNINGTGTVVIGGNRGAQADAYFALGKIASDRGGIQWVYTPATDTASDYTTITAIPEPATLSLLALGAMALLGKKK